VLQELRSQKKMSDFKGKLKNTPGFEKNYRPEIDQNGDK
jgi:hypothetical protein